MQTQINKQAKISIFQPCRWDSQTKHQGQAHEISLEERKSTYSWRTKEGKTELYVYIYPHFFILVNCKLYAYILYQNWNKKEISQGAIIDNA